MSYAFLLNPTSQIREFDCQQPEVPPRRKPGRAEFRKPTTGIAGRTYLHLAAFPGSNGALCFGSGPSYMVCYLRLTRRLEVTNKSRRLLDYRLYVK